MMGAPGEYGRTWRAETDNYTRNWWNGYRWGFVGGVWAGVVVAFAAWLVLT